MKLKFKIKIGFFSVLLSLALIISNPKYFSALFFSVFLHELGHLLGARLCRIQIAELKLGIFGAGITPAKLLCSYKKEIILCFFGPLANFLSLALATVIIRLFSISVGKTDFLNMFLLSSFALGFMNLLPIESFDGGRILSALLSLRLSPAISHTVISVISFIFIFILWILSVYFLLRSTSSLSLFIFCSFMFAKIFIKDAV